MLCPVGCRWIRAVPELDQTGMNEAMGRLKVGVVYLARRTFDVELAESIAVQVQSLLAELPIECLGSSRLLFDEEQASKELSNLRAESIDLLLVAQLTFTDATMTVKVAEELKLPLLLWSFPENRTGERLRLNSLCGANLAAHALGKSGIRCDYLYKRADDPAARSDLEAWMRAGQAIKSLAATRLGVIGRHPDGFDTCAYDKDELKELFGVIVDQIPLPDLFNGAKQISEREVEEVRAEICSKIKGLEEVDQESLDKSLRVFAALRSKASTGGFQGFAIRCWPEFFTDYGCAACGAMGLLNTRWIAAGCEADVYGTLTVLILNSFGDEPSFIADLVDINPVENSGVFWHCGLAPLSMADPASPVTAGIHSNRKKPLVNEFALKPGRVTLARLSQSHNQTRIVIGGGEILKAPKSFSGTSGVIRFDRSADEVLDTIMGEGLEHHYGIAYCDFGKPLRSVARQLGIPVLELT